MYYLSFEVALINFTFVLGFLELCCHGHNVDIGYNLTQKRLLCDFFHTKILLTCKLFESCGYTIETVSILIGFHFKCLPGTQISAFLKIRRDKWKLFPCGNQHNATNAVNLTQTQNILLKISAKKKVVGWNASRDNELYQLVANHYCATAQDNKPWGICTISWFGDSNVH